MDEGVSDSEEEEASAGAAPPAPIITAPEWSEGEETELLGGNAEKEIDQQIEETNAEMEDAPPLSPPTAEVEHKTSASAVTPRAEEPGAEERKRRGWKRANTPPPVPKSTQTRFPKSNGQPPLQHPGCKTEMAPPQKSRSGHRTPHHP